MSPHFEQQIFIQTALDEGPKTKGQFSSCYPNIFG